MSADDPPAQQPPIRLTYPAGKPGGGAPKTTIRVYPARLAPPREETVAAVAAAADRAAPIQPSLVVAKRPTVRLFERSPEPAAAAAAAAAISPSTSTTKITLLPLADTAGPPAGGATSGLPPPPSKADASSPPLSAGSHHPPGGPTHERIRAFKTRLFTGLRIRLAAAASATPTMPGEVAHGNPPEGGPAPP